TDEEHKARWGRPITIDHKNKNRKENTMENLQTLCLVCHGSKDISAHLKTEYVPKHKDEVLRMRAAGVSFQHIADTLGFSVAAVWKWCRRWGDATDLRTRS